MVLCWLEEGRGGGVEVKVSEEEIHINLYECIKKKRDRKII